MTIIKPGIIVIEPEDDDTCEQCGKVDELREVVIATGADTVICDGELEPAQLRNLEDRVGV